MIDKAWLAGFFDGDGTVGIYHRKRSRGRTAEWFVMVGFGQHDPAILHEIRDHYGGVLYHRGSTNKPGTYGSVWQLTFSHRKAERILKAIQPHVKVKKIEVEIALEFRAIRNKPGIPGAPIDRYIELAQELKDAKHRRTHPGN